MEGEMVLDLIGPTDGLRRWFSGYSTNFGRVLWCVKALLQAFLLASSIHLHSAILPTNDLSRQKWTTTTIGLALADQTFSLSFLSLRLWVFFPKELMPIFDQKALYL